MVSEIMKKLEVADSAVQEELVRLIDVVVCVLDPETARSILTKTFFESMQMNLETNPAL